MQVLPADALIWCLHQGVFYISAHSGTNVLVDATVTLREIRSQIHRNEAGVLTVRTCWLQQPSGLDRDYWMISRRTLMCLTKAWDVC